ncbi:MAG: pyridoxamine kinase [Ruminococcaceae bacterium]|nr:pyridoxamine kinase [Oscillospiraceae bacterium]
MKYPRVLTIQDISCVGQCSLTVALPIISACGIETAVLPSAVLSTHTAGFKGYTFRDLTEDMPSICDHWVKEGICFDAIYTGYLGSTKQIEYVVDIFKLTAADGCYKIVDPAMADNGKLYPGFNMAFVNEMKGLCGKADYVIPNLTEACLLTDTEYRESYDEGYINEIVDKLHRLGCKNVIFTGVSYKDGMTGVLVSDGSKSCLYEHKKEVNSCHGTGDIYASAFVGALVKGKNAYDAAVIAADYTVACIRETANDPTHWYGARFEPVLGKLIEMIVKENADHE